ncbi:MAG: topoisomerase DNA-binding C4 zinc finger domain-containing protein, partial [Dehalococcoidales bacterium]|nr:topoisomerase DNA-binding C4 zinc finger domain-containing protein [Dehalococcoidales bacterium]
VVSDLLAQNFPDVVNLGFTAHMEEELDAIARGEKAWVPVLREFYEPFNKDLIRAMEKVERVKFKEEPAGESCPTCGRPMVIKLGRYGKFIACPGYPECRTTRPFYVKIGIRCPECGGDIIERESKLKKIFYGCSNYPTCKFITGRRPVATPCPECKGLLTLYSRGKVKCQKCSYSGPLVDEESIEQEAVTPISPVISGKTGKN